MEQKGKVIRYKLLYTGIIVLVFLTGKKLPLYGVDVSVYVNRPMDAQTILTQAISGDLHRCSLFALGISPYMMASLLVQVASVLKGADGRSRISPRKKSKVLLGMALIFAVVQAVTNLRGLTFEPTAFLPWIVKSIAGIEMVAGAMMIVWLASGNARFGIGGQSVLIFINLLEGIGTMIGGHSVKSLLLPVAVSAVLFLVMLIMENAEIRIPVQRISIHNIYADKNYMAMKLNPIGVMPVMFSTAFFHLPQFLVSGLAWLMPGTEEILWWKDNLNLSKPLGIAVYIGILYLLTIGFSRAFLNPADITEQFLKSGDSIPGVHAGRDTKRFLSKRITGVGFFSATVLGICLGIPMIMQIAGTYDNALAALPSSVMILIGVWCNLYRETEAVKSLDTYKLDLN